MKYKDKLEIARKLVCEGKSDFAEMDGSVVLIAFSNEEEERLKDIVIDKLYPFTVKMIGLKSISV